MCLLWAIAEAGQLFYEKDENLDKNDSFECGFENTTLGDQQLNFKNIIIFSFLLLYDLELLLLLPVSFNIIFFQTNTTPILLLLGTLFYTCIWDIETKTLEYEN